MQKGSAATPRKKSGARDKRRRPIAIQPGLGQRLIEVLDAADVPKSARTAVVCEETGRQRQAVVRWFPSPTNKQPGCPDLESFAALCIRFGLDANWLLGITENRYRLPKTVPAGEFRVEEPAQRARQLIVSGYCARLERDLASIAPHHELFTMAGDEMEPRIRDGALMAVDTGIQEIAGNGIYLLDYRGRQIVRIVEHRIGQGIALRCANGQYQDTVIADAAGAKKLGIRVIGQVRAWQQTVVAGNVSNGGAVD